MYCNKCGNKLNTDSKFCDNCGAPVFASTGSSNNINSNYMSVHKRNTIDIIVLLLLIISVAVFFSKTGVDGDIMFSSLCSYEHTVATVPIFFMSMFNLLFFIFKTTDRPYYFLTAVGIVNTILSLFLIIPNGFDTQYVCAGSAIILIVNMLISILSILMKYYTHRNINRKMENQITNAVFHKLRNHRKILRVISLIAVSTFLMPMAITSCNGSNEKTSTGIDLINNFDDGIGNGYAIGILVVFIAAFILLCVKKRALLPLCFVCGIIGVVSIIMSKFIFEKYIVKYLIGSYIAFFCSVAMTAVGYKFYKKGKELYKTIESNHIK